jgi:hypothetical protein
VPFLDSLLMDWRGWVLPRFGGRKPPAESLSTPDPADLQRLEELGVRGSRLELPHPVRAFVAFDDEATARAACELLTRDGFKCQPRTSRERGWTVTAVREMVPTPGAITRLRERMEEVARNLGGSFGGWDAPPVY